MRILFVCTGNTCRSCMAEAIFNKICDSHGTKAYSAGICIIEGSVTSNNAARVLKDNLNVDIFNRSAINLTSNSISDSDLILTMTKGIRNILLEQYPNFKSKIFTLSQYIGLEEDVEDPYGGDLETYKRTFDKLFKNIRILIDKIKKDNSVT